MGARVIGRRTLLKSGVFVAAAPALAASPNEKLNIGFVGTAGMRGGAHLGACRGENVYALCDVDEKNLAKSAAAFKPAKQYHDFREMIDKESETLDAVVVSTPDHIHAPAIARALKAGLHVYSEKPLTHTVGEAREIARLAAKHHRVTQMGTQIHAGTNYRRVVELVRSGAVGTVREAHVWLGGTPWWANDPPKGGPPPGHLHWDLWLGPAKERPYDPLYHPTKWRKWWAFGGGHLADMGCHYIDVVFWSLQLKHPLTAVAEGPKVHAEGAPKWLHVTWEFPAWGETAPLKLHWYHGDRRPEEYPAEKLGGWNGPGALFVGDKGLLVTNYGKYALLPEEKFKDFRAPEPWIPDSLGHHAEWIDACKKDGPTTCNFQYAGALTETVLLGNVAYRTGKKIDWDAAGLKARGVPEADALIRKEYRPGWEL